MRVTPAALNTVVLLLASSLAGCGDATGQPPGAPSPISTHADVYTVQLNYQGVVRYIDCAMWPGQTSVSCDWNGLRDHP